MSDNCEVCGLHSGIERDIAHVCLKAEAGHKTASEAHARIDLIEQNKVPNRLFYWLVGIIIAAFLGSSGTLYWKVSEIQTSIAVIKSQLIDIREKVK